MVFFLLSQCFLAESLYFNNDYDLALVEYKRLFFSDSIFRSNFNLRLHYTIASLKFDFLKGYEEIEKLLGDFPGNEAVARIKLGRELFKIGNYKIVIDILSPIQNPDPETKRLLGFAYLFNYQYHHARRVFLDIDSTLVLDIEKFIKKPEKSITRAMFLSAVLPGSGEIYSGDIKRGIQGFLLTFLSGFLMYKSIKDKEYVDAGIVFSFAFNRFYLGSISNAQMIAQRQNEESKKKWLDYIKEKYLNSFSD